MAPEQQPNEKSKKKTREDTAPPVIAAVARSGFEMSSYSLWRHCKEAISYKHRILASQGPHNLRMRMCEG